MYTGADLSRFLVQFSIDGIGNAPPTLGSIADLAIGLFNTFAYAFVPIALVAYIIYAGFNRMMAGTDPKKVAESNAMLMWAIVGSLVVMGTMVIITIILNLAGVSGLAAIPNPF